MIEKICWKRSVANYKGCERMELDSRALDIIKILQSKGFQTVIVGGAIRDSILGLTPKDYDISN